MKSYRVSSFLILILSIFAMPLNRSVLLAEISSPIGDTGEILFTIPVGGEGVHYSGLGNDRLAWGPSAFTIADDDTFWLADTAANRVVNYDRHGNYIKDIQLHELTAVTDLVMIGKKIFVLDSSALLPRVIVVDTTTDSRLATFPIPHPLRKGLTGIAANSVGEIFVEQESGSILTKILDKNGQPVAELRSTSIYGGKTAQLANDIYGSISQDNDITGSDIIVADGKKIKIKALNTLGGSRLLAFNGSHIFTEEVSREEIIRVDQKVRHFDEAGNVLGVARVPLEGNFTFVAKNITLGHDGSLYAFVTRSDHAEVRRLYFTRELEEILPPLDIRRPEDMPLWKNEVDVSCISRDVVLGIAQSYLENLQYLSAVNISGRCAGRTAPRYLSGISSGAFPSVSYDWGGYDSVLEFNVSMLTGFQAGNIRTNTSNGLSCARGVDCSGFVTNAWQSSRFNTRSVTRVTNRLASFLNLKPGDIINYAGSHMRIYLYATEAGVYFYESTEFQSMDRVIFQFHPWSNFASHYAPLRYKKICQQDASTISVQATLDGQAWPGPVNFQLNGPYSRSYSQLPSQIFGVVPGEYSITYLSGGPSNARLDSISPPGKQVLSEGSSITFVINFRSLTAGPVSWTVSDACGQGLLVGFFDNLGHSYFPSPTTYYKVPPKGTETFNFTLRPGASSVCLGATDFFFGINWCKGIIGNKPPNYPSCCTDVPPSGVTKSIRLIC